jgi:hypothetical protein
MIEIKGLTKIELKQLLIKYQKEIVDIDEKGIYSLSYYYYDEVSKRQQLVALLDAVEKEIMYREDDEKRDKYRTMRERDPLKYGRKKILENYK